MPGECLGSASGAGRFALKMTRGGTPSTLQRSECASVWRLGIGLKRRTWILGRLREQLRQVAHSSTSIVRARRRASGTFAKVRKFGAGEEPVGARQTRVSP